MIEALLERAQQLLSSGRYNEAEKELKNVLAQDPNHSTALALYAICVAERGEANEALTIIGNAIRNQPDNDYFLYLQSLFLLKNDKYKEAERSIRNAIAFHPKNADYFGLLSMINLSQKEWQKALEYANEGLQIDADNLQCLNSRSTALSKLDRKEDAYATIQEALDQDPENEATHTNLGWGLLEHGNHKKALEHFREALKINPNYAYAKAGLVEGLKARYWFYRVFLKYAFWLSNMKAKGQWLVILGLYFGVRFLRSIADSNNTLSIILTPVIYLYFVFAISTWLIEPLSNLFLRLNIYGRYALTKTQIQSSTCVGVSLCVGVLGGLIYLGTDNFIFFMVLIFGLSMMIPLASMFNAATEGKRKILIGYTILLGVLGMGAILLNGTEIGGVLVPAYILGVFAYQWIANALITSG
jgi:tetratricopeptide (TPR) repeat protein